MLRTYAALADDVVALPPRLGDVRLVVIDGPAGSGKTTFADRLSAALGHAQVVHMDDLYDGWAGLDASVLERLTRHILEPLREGRDGSYQGYDWKKGRFDEWHAVPVPVATALILEGVGAGGRPVDPYAVLRVWLEAPPELRLERGVRRDGESLREEWLAWSRREVAHFATDRTRERADLVLDGTAGTDSAYAVIEDRRPPPPPPPR